MGRESCLEDKSVTGGAGPAGGYTLTANHGDEGPPTHQAGDLFSDNEGTTGAKLSKMSAHPDFG
jgi:hypothetical protein